MPIESQTTMPIEEKITLGVEEFKELIRISTRVDILRSILELEGYVSTTDVRTILFPDTVNTEAHGA